MANRDFYKREIILPHELIEPLSHWHNGMDAIYALHSVGASQLVSLHMIKEAREELERDQRKAQANGTFADDPEALEELDMLIGELSMIESSPREFSARESGMDIEEDEYEYDSDVDDDDEGIDGLGAATNRSGLTFAEWCYAAGSDPNELDAKSRAELRAAWRADEDPAEYRLSDARALDGVRVTGRQTITTKYHGPTNSRGSRVTAKAEAGSVTVSWDHALDSQRNHEKAAQALIDKLGWGGEWVGGATARGDGYTFVEQPSAGVGGLGESARRKQHAAYMQHGGYNPYGQMSPDALIRVTGDGRTRETTWGALVDSKNWSERTVDAVSASLDAGGHAQTRALYIEIVDADQANGMRGLGGGLSAALNAVRNGLGFWNPKG